MNVMFVDEDGKKIANIATSFVPNEGSYFTHDGVKYYISKIVYHIGEKLGDALETSKWLCATIQVSQIDKFESEDLPSGGGNKIGIPVVHYDNQG